MPLLNPADCERGQHEVAAERDEHVNEVVVAETTLQPEPEAWAARTPDREGPFEDLRRRTRTAMGLPEDETIVATGHQAGVWHPGILAKDLAISAFASRSSTGDHGVRAIHFIVDHDANDAGLVSYPTRDLTRGSWRLAPAADGRCTRDRPATRATPPPTDAIALPSVTTGLEAIHAAVTAQSDATDLAWQMGLATATLARPFTGEIPRHSMSRLLETPIGLELLDRMARDPEGCIEAHDAAIEADRRARATGHRRLPRGVARLLGHGSVRTLPLWRATTEGRRPVHVGDRLDPTECRPRALMATALARLGGCDLFVHGLGGGVYDRAMEDWIGRWLGPEAMKALAPATVATADLRLPLEATTGSDEPIATPEGLHRLRSNPDLGRTDPPRRETLVARIDAAPRRSDARRMAFKDLRREIDRARERGHEEIARYRDRLASGREERRRRDVALDRTWAFPLHETKDVRMLAADVVEAFELG